MPIVLSAYGVAHCFFSSSRRRHTRYIGDWSSDVCSSDLLFRGQLRAPEGDVPAPVEIYGRWKLAAEEHLLSLSSQLPVKIVRTPTIVAAGRLGLLSILFEFIHEGRRVWLVGDGGNRYQFVSAEDLADACVLLSTSSSTGIFHVGSESVPTGRGMV